jgi:2',3'-cyclic-nucleotide 2'-phosphodiesterase / 3'-nucleotidase
LVKMESFAPDPDFMQLFSTNMEAVMDYSSQPVANITSTITSVDALFGDAAFTDLIHQAQLEITGAQVSLAAPFSLNSELKAGQLRVRDMFQLYRFENLIYTMTLTGREITDHLEYSYELWINTMKDADDNMLKLRKDESGDITISNGQARLENPIYNFDNAEGIIYSVDLTKPFGGRVLVVSLNDGSLFDPDENYLVAVNSYRGNGGGNHLTDGAGIQKADLKQRVVTTSELDFRYYLMEWLREREVMQPEVNHNWKFIPENWIENAAAKDRELLFGRQ